jgi:hypothetical protein
MNWFAGFFQTLEKSSVALVLKGVQGSGKSVFFDHVITPLFGEKYCVVVDQGRIESQFKNWIENRIFFNLNEVAVDMKGRKDLKNFLKQLVTDRYVYAELKHKDAEPVRIYGNIYITSNEHLPVEIEPSDRRFTVFDTAGNIRELGWDTKQLIEDIESELIYFARFLKAHKVDWDMYHTALDTPEKRAIQSGTNSKLSLYLKAVLKRDAEIFTGLLELTDDYQGNRNLHASIIADFENGTIDQTNLIQAYKKMYEVDHSPRKIMENIRMMEPAVFAKEKMKITSGSKYYSLPGK